MFGFSHGGRGHHHHRFGSRGGGGFDPERFFHWIERLNDSEHRRGGGGGGGGRSRRMFDGSELRLVLLKLIADTPRHGYEIIKAIETLTGGAYAPSPGVVYPTLTLLDEMELIAEQASEGARKRFAVTDAGRAHLDEQSETVATLMARLEALAAQRAQGEGEGAPVRRAMHNLRHAVMDRVKRADASPELLHEIAGLIDEVAQKVERLK
ncbi:PadR family transcriptional regulator [Sphingomonas endophytica]|uniref:DNA-binding PadR family transcriptional regulator n=1 Tax=Sphingomonas endophytica TaxID=869719 RepID=A0ABR6N0U5_9SPHN|nr:PadR family transcriptional regulator [Sphingomonas endophytica]MBB5724408.1 DNA-binding PadR family transcriptional regulator [Sphingomonas endophytica]